MKKLYLAMDSNGGVFSFKEMPSLFDGVWKGVRSEYVIDIFKEFGISKDKLTHETPIKIRAVWGGGGMKIKLNQEVTWLGKKFAVKELYPMPFAMLLLADNQGHEEYLLYNNVDEFIKENGETA